MVSRNTSTRLTLLTLLVFAVVLIIFSVSVFFVFANELRQDTHAELRRMADAVIASIDFDEDKNKNIESAKPDLILSEMPNTSEVLNALKLEWFDYQGKFVAARGTFPVHTPLSETEKFEQLENPRGVMFTKPVWSDGRKLGYVRVAEPLNKQDEAIESLSIGLLAGILASLLASGLGTALLVRQSMVPIFNAMDRLKQFTSDASHELRNPITAVSTNSSVALKHAEGMRASDKEKFELIQQAALQMQHLVERLLQLSRAEHVQKEKAHTNLANVIQEVVTNSASADPAKNIDLQIDVPPDIEVQINSEDLRCIVSNLLENAIRYSHENALVQLRAIKKNSYVNLVVKDNGVGIAPKDLDKIFDRFWRADKARNHDDPGQGLGLSIVQALVKRHDGRISVSSEEGKGAEFSVLLKTWSAGNSPPSTVL